jgi:penicillin-binding protein 1B
VRLRIRITRGFWSSRFGLGLLALTLAGLLGGAGLFTFYYVRYARMIDERLGGQVFQNPSGIYTAPRPIAVGESLTPAELVSYLQRAGYSDAAIPGAAGRYRVGEATVEIWPSGDSYFAGRNALQVEFSGRRVNRLRALDSGAAAAELEPELLTNLFDRSREKRRPVRFEDLPEHLVDAVLAAEDKRFFEHPGLDLVRVLGAAWADIRSGSKAQGASTITMQVARSFFFTTERTWRRKLAETMVAVQLEQRFTKREIFTLYANQIYLGNRGSFAIHGFGEAAQAYYGKDVRELTLGESAFLAGIIRAPNRYSAAERRPERALEARERVLAQMVANQMITEAAAEAARKAPLRMAGPAVESGAAPYFVDLVKDHVLDRYPEAQWNPASLRIYTTLDPRLQRAAAEAVEEGIKHVDNLLARRYQQWRSRGEAVPLAQVALVALDPRTGEIKALVGGRNYGLSQLNRALARRQPGSAFKPFVYAAAFANAVDGYDPVLTTVTTVVDEPTTFVFGDEEYMPNNYGQQYYGTVTLREALTRSLNVATVKVGELVGFPRVVQVARQMGLGPRIQPTPAVALGAYEMTPIEVAAAYTVFATGGHRAEPMFVRRVASLDGAVNERRAPEVRPVLDPRVAYLVHHVLAEVLDRGTGAGVRARGFTAPGGGKTGTSHDGWFAGYTSNLVTVVWVGFDDNRELGLSGAAAAAPLWAGFMTRALALPGYRDAQPFTPPAGITVVRMDPASLQLTSLENPAAREEVFIAGSEPPEFFLRPPDYTPGWFTRLFGGGRGESTAVPPAAGDAERRLPPGRIPQAGEANAPGANGAAGSATDEKKSFLRRFFGIFGGGEKERQREGKSPPPP